MLLKIENKSTNVLCYNNRKQIFIEFKISFIKSIKTHPLEKVHNLKLCSFVFMQKNINIQNKKARFLYEILDKYTAGIVLTGTEIKSIRNSKASIAESFCEFNEQGELFVINMTIEEYLYGTYYNHKPKAERKLLLNKKELKKLLKEVQNTGLTIIPLKLFINEKGYAKLDIALAKGKKLYDKRESIKDRDNKRDLDRVKKIYK